MNATALVGQVLLVPLEQIEEDPNQPRKNFDAKGLEELADNIEDTAAGSDRPWRDGLLHPVVAYPNPAFVEGGDTRPLRLLVGARRLRAYQLRGWPEIPVAVHPTPSSVVRVLMTQLNENLGRRDTSLLEDARAIEAAWNAWQTVHPDGRLRDFAAAFSRSASWVSQHLFLAKLTGVPGVALRENLLQHGDTARQFSQLPTETQLELLRRARALGTLITIGVIKDARARLDAAKKAQAAATVAATPTAEPGAAAAPATSDPALDDTQVLPAPEDGRLPVRLTPHEIRWLLVALRQKPPAEERELVTSLRETLARLATHLRVRREERRSA
jgi:ParB/RepB/Spo0J family partition protein